MKIIVADQLEKKAVKKVLKRINALFSALPTCREDFIEPESAEEYILMWNLFTMPVQIHSSEKLLTIAFPNLADEYQNEFSQE